MRSGEQLVRTRGNVADVRGLGPGDHICWSYDGPDHFWSGVAAYFAEGVDGPDKLLLFTDSLSPDEALTRLEAEGLPAARLAGTGQLAVVDARGAYLTDGVLDTDQMVVALGQGRDQAVAEGWRSLRAAGEVAWVFALVPELESFLAYELQADHVVAQGGMTGLCAYDGGQSEAGWLTALETVHPVHVRSGVDAPETSFSLSMAPSGEVVVAGEVDLASAPAFEQALRVAAQAVPDLTLDVGALAFVNVSGLRALAGLGESLADGGRTVVVRSARPLVRRCWELLDFDRVPNVVLS